MNTQQIKNIKVGTKVEAWNEEWTFTSVEPSSYIDDMVYVTLRSDYGLEQRLLSTPDQELRIA